MTEHKLYNTLETISREGKTGTVHIFGKMTTGRQLYCVITVENGQVQYLGLASRPEAVSLSLLLSLQITGVQFSNSRRNWSLNGNGGVPDMLTVLGGLRRSTAPKRPLNNSTPRQTAVSPRPAPAAPTPAAPHNLHLEAAKVLQKLYGNNAYSHIAAISQQFPPEQFPQQFLDGCVEAAAHAVGSQMAEAMLRHLR